MKHRWGALRYDGHLRAYERELDRDPVSGAGFKEFEDQHRGKPFANNADDTELTSGRSLPAQAWDNMVAPIRLARVMAIGRKRRFDESRFAPTMVAAGIVAAVAGLAFSYLNDPAKEYADQSDRPGYNTAERTVLDDVRFMDILGLCKAKLDDGIERYDNGRNTSRVIALQSASQLAVTHNVSCAPLATSVDVLVGGQSVAVTADELFESKTLSRPYRPVVGY